jgi:xyloglucan:xyloglucosyl transferase
MARLQVVVMALFISAIALDQSFVNANFYKSMYFNPGANNWSSIVGTGNDLHLVLDNKAGKHNLLVSYTY